VVAVGQAVEDEAEVLEVGVASGELGRTPARAGRVGVLTAVDRVLARIIGVSR